MNSISEHNDLGINNETGNKDIQLTSTKRMWSIIKQTILPFKNFIHPETVKENGQKRLVSVDFLKGIAIFIMLCMHVFADSMAHDAADNPVYYVFAGPIAATAGFRTFFVMISGISHAFVFGASIFGKQLKEVVISQLISLIGSFLALPLYYVFHVANLMAFKFQFGQLNMPQPWYRGMDMFSHPPIYFGFSQPVNQIVLLLMYLCIIKPMSRIKKMTQYHILFVVAALSFITAVALLFAFMPISDSLRRSFAKQINIDPALIAVDNRECPGNYFGPAETLQEHLRNLFYHFLSGTWMQMNCHYAFFMIGLSIGFILVAFKFHKNEILKSSEEPQDKKKHYMKVRMYYLMYFSFSPLIIVAVELGLLAQVRAQMKSGVRSFIFDTAAFAANYYPKECFVPEYCAAIMCAQMYCVVLAVALFECTTTHKAKVRAERILFLRRMSSFSFSCFVFGLAVNQPLNNILKVQDSSLSAWGYIGYLVIYFITHLLIQCLFDTFEDKITPDWFIKRFAHIFTMKEKFTPVSEQHLNVAPINLFGKLD
ncbi:Transmembrane_domain-containing protein [Hexamita inflata]|uniref:Transmembrane domain-containing protein n=1 Tax=Hexamita inflata TaxID=28002 RepID=A0AA86V9C1_9EUKA|nr:Transmembrane domain-containing protein [Hexamita inflata]